MKKAMIFYQLFEPQSSTYTYLLADPESKEAVLIDPVVETLERDLKWVEEAGVKLKYVLDTHVHADHITAANALRERLGVKTAVSSGSQVTCADILLEDGQELHIGGKTIRALATPGHTDSCMSYYTEGMVFTGDALLIRGCGRTDFQQGSSEKLYDSVHQKLFSLPEETIVYPGHDYRGLTSSTIGMERTYNPRLGMGKTKEDFVKIMAELKLANPKKIAEAVPANLACGKTVTSRALHPQLVDGVPEVIPAELHRQKDKVRIIDVRRPEEFNSELGHIPGAELVTLGEDLSRLLRASDRMQEIVFVCRSGGRSHQATVESMQLGYKNSANLIGGMIRWNEESLPVERG